MDKLSKIEKLLGVDTIKEMEAMPEESLRQVIVEANQAMKIVADELEANTKYQELKASLSALTAGKRDVNKRQKGRIAYALKLLADQGKEPLVGITEKA